MRAFVAMVLAGAVVFLGAMALGIFVSFRLAPERLHHELELGLARGLRGPVAIESLRVVPSWGLGLVAEGITFWEDAEGPQVRIGRATARLKTLPLLAGRIRLARLDLDRAVLRVERDAAGAFRPAPFRSLGPGREPRGGAPAPPQEQLLSPLIQLEAGLRRLLARPLLAEVLVVRESRVEFVDAAASGGPRRIALSDFELRSHRSPWIGSHVVTASARLADSQGTLGGLDWECRRRRGGDMRFALAATALDLEGLGSRVGLRPLGADAGRVEGRVSGVIAYETPSPGHGQLDVDLSVRDLRAVAPGAARRLGPIEAERASARVVLGITPQEVQVSEARIASGPLDLRFEGSVERPLRAESTARLRLAFREMALARALDLVGWLPAERRAEAVAVVRPVEAGRLVELTAAGVAPLGGWRSLLAGRTQSLPEGLEISGELRDGRIHVGDGDRLEDLAGRVIWRGDRIEVRGARGRLGEIPLPVLDLSLQGVSHLLATAPARRVLHAGAEPLRGMSALWAFFAGPADDDPAEMPTTLQLQIDHLEHPMLLWPIQDVRARVGPIASGVHIVADSGTWAGAAVQAEADWLFEPEERVVVRVRAGPGAPGGHRPHAAGIWAEGRFAVGALQKGMWRHLGARGRFEAENGAVSLRNVTIDLAPPGRLLAAARLDLARPGVVPFHLDVAMHEGDVGALANQVGMPDNAATGRIEMEGSFAGRLQRGRFFRDLSGRLRVSASAGEIRRKVPPVVALALASDGFNPFAGREAIRYERIETEFAFAEGKLRTERFTVDGPDLRVVAAGELDLGVAPHRLDASVALFLFRQIDWVLGKIPLLNRILLGPDDNLVAAYYTLKGPWIDPQARMVPLRSFASGPGSLVFETVPDLLKRGWHAIGDALRRGDQDAGPASLGGT